MITFRLKNIQQQAQIFPGLQGVRFTPAYAGTVLNFLSKYPEKNFRKPQEAWVPQYDLLNSSAMKFDLAGHYDPPSRSRVTTSDVLP